MRQNMFWLDWTFCSLWTLIVLANCSWHLPSHLLMIVMVVVRIVLSFALYRKEKRSWVPLVVFTALFALLAVVGQVMTITGLCANLLFAVLGIAKDPLVHDITKWMLLAWLFLVPWAVYVVGLCRKTMVVSTLTWKEALGAILWKDKEAKMYGGLMLIAVFALYAGLAMDARMCRFACLVLPSLSLYVLAKHVGSCVTEGNRLAGKLGLMVASMTLFFYAQRYAGMWRVWMLVASLLVVAYVCWRTLGKQRSILASIYLGMMLPTLAIGYNQYACIDCGRLGLNTLEPLRGVFYVRDSRTDKIGLRDRYGLVVEPAYESIVHNIRNRPLWVYELRRNGYYALYDAYHNERMQTNVADQMLQDSICRLLDAYCEECEHGCRDKLEVRVTSKFQSEALLSHVKLSKCGHRSYYDYLDRPYISKDSATLRSGEFGTDSTACYMGTMPALRYSYDVARNNTVLCNIDIKVAGRSMPRQEALAELAKRIETLIEEKLAKNR